MDPELIGSAEAARRLGVTRSKLQRLVHAGRLTPVTRGEGVRGPMVFDATAIDSYGASRESGGRRHTAARALIRELYDDAGVRLDDYSADDLAGRVSGPVPTRRSRSTSD